MTEAEWQQMLLDLAHLLGWQHMHVRRSIGKGTRWTTATSMKGWPDLTLMRPATAHVPGELIFVEVKAQDGRTTPDQDQCHELLRSTGHDVYVWRPSDLDEATHRLSRHRNATAPRVIPPPNPNVPSR